MIEISAAAALDVAALQRNGYRGVALVSDPLAGCMVLFRADDDGCQPFGTAAMPITAEAHTLLPLASLVIPLGVTPEQAFQIAEREIRRLINNQRN
jgi:hypothetical protein